MTATLTATFSSAGKLRPLNVLRDLPAVADLIELCFSATLDPDGRSYIDQMRRSGRDSGFLNWAPYVIESVSLPLSGFVWEDDGRIVGNVSLIPFSQDGQQIFLIANVATHPEYRRRGIARQLTEVAMQRARAKSAGSIWLHVRDDNPGALSLYRELGFQERTCRTNWIATAGTLTGNLNQAINIQVRPARDWRTQRAWLERDYPSRLNWYFSHRWKILNPGLPNRLYRFLADINILQWAAYRDGNLEGVLAYERTNNRSDYLWLAVPPRPNLEAVTALLLHGRQMLSQRHSLALEFPQGPLDKALLSAGFRSQRTLVWMEAPGAQLAW